MRGQRGLLCSSSAFTCYFCTSFDPKRDFELKSKLPRQSLNGLFIFLVDKMFFPFFFFGHLTWVRSCGGFSGPSLLFEVLRHKGLTD